MTRPAAPVANPGLSVAVVASPQPGEPLPAALPTRYPVAAR
jgi:hypothetical protein